MKTIAISNTINGAKTVVETAAKTLGELKQFMSDNNISYPADALWYSGLTKSRLEFDSSEFLSDTPRTCNINGQERDVYGVVLIVPSKNKIESGMTRGEAYIFICENDLKEEVKERFGKNFTNVSTEDLIDFIENYDDESDEEECEEECRYDARTPLDILKAINLMLGKTIETIENRFNGNCKKAVSEEDDLDKMLKNLR